MLKECDAAAWWIASLIKSENDLQINEQIVEFQKYLKEEMIQKYTGHWYEDEPDRGHAFRSILFDRTIDPILVSAASKVGINLKDRVKVQFIMWVDPHCVKVQHKHSYSHSVVYQTPRQKLPSNLLYCKSDHFNVKMQPTPLQIVNKAHS